MSSRTSRALGILTVLGTIAAGSYGTAFWLLRDRGPSAEAIEAAARELRTAYEPGDLILIQPFYATRAREWLGDLDPVAPQNPLLEDFETHRRVHVFGLFGSAEALAEPFLRMGLSRVKVESPTKGITIATYSVSATTSIEYSFRDELKRARVTYEQTDGKLEPCDRYTDEFGRGGAMGRWSCRRDAEWFYVGKEWHRMGDHPRLCLWAHPPNSGRLRIEFGDVPLTGILAGRAGHTLNSSLHARERVDLEIEISGVGRQVYSFGLSEHWRPFSLVTPDVGTATVTFSVSSPDAGANHFCFEASMRRRSG
ncbi:MAG: hypothetical protein HY791_27105 [Deltaproteobacteria bacterium]|nr:hypothetical protein [Deltaproteobacteria bacterium]